MNDSILPTSPVGRGAELVSKAALDDFLNRSVDRAREHGVIGALLLVRVGLESSQAPSPFEVAQACSVVAQLTRQVDAMAQVAPDTFAVVLNRVARRSDVHVILDRIEDFVNSSNFSWEISTGIGVFPLCGDSAEEAFQAAQRDLEGAMSSDTWEHEIPRETIRTRQVG